MYGNTNPKEGLSEAFIAERQQELSGSDVVIYGKGTKLMPMCGFTAQVIQIFRELSAQFKVVNILDSEELRQGMKLYSDWPTFPQIYVRGEFIGGCDIVTEIYRSGELESLLEKTKMERSED